MTVSIHSAVMAILSILLTPFYCYGLLKWYQFRSHFLIQNRFPKEVCILIIFTYIIKIVSTIRSFLLDLQIFILDDNIDSALLAILMALSYFVLIYIFYRAYLIYLKCIQNRMLLQKTNTDFVSNVKLVKKLSSRCLLIYCITTSFIICITQLIFPKHHFIANSIFSAFATITFIIGIIIIIIIIKNKVNDLLGAKMDIFIGCISVLINSSINAITPLPIYAVRIIAYLSLTVLSLFPLWYCLILLRKYEGSLNIHTFKRKLLYKHKDEHRKSKLKIESSESVVTVSQSVDDMDPLYVYLKKEENYKLFGQHLTLCFAMENLLFVSHVLVFYHSILQIVNKKQFTYIRKPHHGHDAYNELVYNLDFVFLDKIYEEYGIDIDCEAFEQIKDKIWVLSQKIYLQFVENDFSTTVNIRYDVKEKLQYLLMTEANKDKFCCIDDFLYLFHDAMTQCYDLMDSCYGYRFVEFIDENPK